MKTNLIHRKILATSFACLLASTTMAMQPIPLAASDEGRPVVQIAILLDNSGSMNGLIEQAKLQLWKIVNEFIAARQGGKAPRVQVALFEYGVSDLGSETGYIRNLSGLTEDLDKLSEQLFSISTRTSGSNEYCGKVVADAVEKLTWDPSPNTYKAIFIAGNEPFTQGPVAYQSACKSAIGKGVIVNTIHCGSEADGIAGAWKDAASLADGRFLVINHNVRVAAIPAPQDKEIAELNGKLNSTYLAYGDMGAPGQARQLAQDGNSAATAAPAEALAQRAAAKASGNYSNASWDLVDRAKDKKFKLEEVPADQLPEAMRKLSPSERKAYIDQKAAERADLQKRITSLVNAREKFIAEKTKAGSETQTLGHAVSRAVREQAQKKGIVFAQ